jgi:hypothetical protein
MPYHFRCSCGYTWAKYSANPMSASCPRCLRNKDTRHFIKFRKVRADARRPPRNLNADEAMAVNRPQRNVKRRADAPPPEPDSDDELEAMADDDADADPDFLLSPEFSINMRYSAGGGFAARIVAGKTRKKSTPWTRIGPRAGRGVSTSAQFGNVTAHDYGHRHAPGYAGQRPTTGNSDYEWCHLIADSLGGPTTAANLFCGTYHANTAMLCLEGPLYGKSEYEIRVEVDVRAKTDLGESIDYYVRKAVSRHKAKRTKPVPFHVTLDARATGCSQPDGEALSKLLCDWMAKNR